MPFCSVCQNEKAEHTDKTCPEQKCKTCGAWGHIFRNCPQKNQDQVPQTPASVYAPEISVTPALPEIQTPATIPIKSETDESQEMYIKPEKYVESTSITSMPGPSAF